MTGRTTIMATAAFAILSQLASAPFPIPLLQIGMPPFPLLPKLLLWNASASAPRGLYLLHPALPLHAGELVAVMPPESLARFAALRAYLPSGVPLLKHIAALDGQKVCRFADRVTIDGRIAALARKRDSRGRTLPRWQGCRTLRAGEVFLLNSAIPDSFDGRYFGVLSANTITARAEPLWIISEP
ncbi:MAG: S26 family signal peptidase [Rhizomicrobium sp.]